PSRRFFGCLVGVLVFFAGLSMALEDLAILKKSFFIISTGLFLKWTLTVALSVVLAVVFFSNLPEIADGLILTGSVPSGTAATLYTFLAGGNASLIVAKIGRASCRGRVEGAAAAGAGGRSSMTTQR